MLVAVSFGLTSCISHSNPVAVIKCGRILIEISNDISETILNRLLQGASMLEDVAKICCDVLVCGMVELRKGIDDLAMIIGDNIIKTHLKRDLVPFLQQAL